MKFANDVTEVRARNAEFVGKVTAIERSQAVIEFDLTGKVLSANPNFLAVFGYELDEVIGQPHRMFCTEEFGASMGYREFWENSAAANTIPMNIDANAKTARKSGFKPLTTRFSTPMASLTKWSSSRWMSPK